MLGHAAARQPAPMLAMRPIGLRLRHGVDALGNAIGESIAAESRPVIKTLQDTGSDVERMQRIQIDKLPDAPAIDIDRNVPLGVAAAVDLSGVAQEYAPLAPNGTHDAVSGRARLVLGNVGQSASADLSGGGGNGLRIDRSQLTSRFWRDDGFFQPRYAPSLGWKEVGDYLNPVTRLKGFWDGLSSITGALDGIANLVKDPVGGLERGGQAMQDSSRQYFLAGRRGDFQSAAAFESRLLGEQASGMVVGVGLGVVAGSGLRVLRYGINALPESTFNSFMRASQLLDNSLYRLNPFNYEWAGSGGTLGAYPVPIGLKMSGIVEVRVPIWATAAQRADYTLYTRVANEAMDAGYLSPTGRVSTSGTLRQMADVEIGIERALARSQGRTYQGAVGHGPDTTWTGKPGAYRWLDQDLRVNSSLGGQAGRYPIGFKPTGFVLKGL